VKQLVFYRRGWGACDWAGGGKIGQNCGGLALGGSQKLLTFDAHYTARATLSIAEDCRGISSGGMAHSEGRGADWWHCD
jgi:hypothetical protein